MVASLHFFTNWRRDCRAFALIQVRRAPTAGFGGCVFRSERVMAGSERKRSESWRRITATAVGLALAYGLLPAQQEPKFSVQVKVVNVPATVRDKHGKIVHDLTKDDFVLEEDSRPQSIHYFSQE